MTGRNHKFTKCALAAVLAAVMLLGQTAVLPVSAAETSGVPDSGLPVLYVNVDENAAGYGTVEEMNASPDHSVSCTGTITLDVPEGYTGDYGTQALSDLTDVKLDYIRGRGNSTWQADKKPYKLKLDKSQDLLGMGKNKHWALLANRFDQSLLRNRLVSWLGSEMGLAYTPKMLPVELVINGEYCGSYLLAEQVRVDKTRVNIDELDPDDNEEPEVSGGYLLALQGAADHPFTDVPSGQYYTDAVLWALEMGVTRGTSESTFSPDRVCTRAELVTLLWRSRYEPSPEDPESPFTDVAPGSYYSDAVLWAAEQGLAKGTGSGLFDPLRVCRRADAVTFVFRAAALE